ncbi:hypothetical protein D3C78_1647670 [compost metagenome]
MFLIPANSSLAATSLTGMIWTPSFLPFGLYRNRLRKLPTPFDSFSALRMLSMSDWSCAGSLIYMMNPACEPLR